MADLPSDVSLGALITVGLVALAVTIVVIFLYIRYFERRRLAAITLAVTFTFWDLGAISVFVGSLIHYLKQPILEGSLQYVRYGFNIGYALSAISNIFLVIFVSQIFAQSSVFRKTYKFIPLINAIFNGVTVGLIIDTIIADPKNPAYPLTQTIYHLVMTFIAFLLLLFFSIGARGRVQLRWEKAGFSFIIGSALAGIMIYLMLALDRVVTLLVPGFEDGYTPFLYIGWTFAILMCTLAYAGYVMPTFLRRLFKEEKNLG
ncbi:MAG: hypothetical protein KGD59_06180 [Candidatus Heimdallarchaeota archaeon]|nr:hypothetical protein [Candidatus Heimdallarchaeota archaeon]MBY8994120.1 hypothetical protein [Candidatus Heimdallarchaeota archaeon]